MNRMVRFLILTGLVVATIATVLAAVFGPWGWWILAVIFFLLLLVGIRDATQRRHSILRNFPVLGHARFFMEKIRPEIQQYFIERNYGRAWSPWARPASPRPATRRSPRRAV